ncbi:hypothetical protein B0H19DRAFT_82917 [Mycena capillaripes]|nr:hypothetical protein B0H19DRAFT_82917 [Mycena capillaripes]
MSPDWPSHMRRRSRSPSLRADRIRCEYFLGVPPSTHPNLPLPAGAYSAPGVYGMPPPRERALADARKAEQRRRAMEWSAEWVPCQCPLMAVHLFLKPTYGAQTTAPRLTLTKWYQNDRARCAGRTARRGRSRFRSRGTLGRVRCFLLFVFIRVVMTLTSPTLHCAGYSFPFALCFVPPYLSLHLPHYFHLHFRTHSSHPLPPSSSLKSLSCLSPCCILPSLSPFRSFSLAELGCILV